MHLSVFCTLKCSNGAKQERFGYYKVLDEGICPLTGTKSGEHMAQDLACLDLWPQISEAESEAVMAELFATPPPPS